MPDPRRRQLRPAPSPCDGRCGRNGRRPIDDDGEPHQREALARNVADSASGDARRNLGWQDFELLVGEAFRMGGYAVTETDGFVLGLQCFSEMPRFAD
jgi:hypothetical protein